QIIDFAGIKKKPETALAALDIEFTADLKIDGLHCGFTIGAKSLRLRFYQMKAQTPMQIYVVAYTTIFTELVICSHRG
ncbi:MAG: hypothetical protein V7752_18900, partial [Halopseudomonas sp.]